MSARVGALALAAVALAAVALGGCLSVPPPDKGPGAIDAAVSADAKPTDGGADPDATGCPTFCTDCTGAVCTIDCSMGQCEDGLDVTCPPGLICAIQCIGDQQCSANPIRCTGGGRCEISCEGTGACELADVICSAAECDIDCIGTDACDHGVFCQSDACQILCDGAAACQDGGGPCCQNADCGTACTAVNGGLCVCTPA